MNDIITVAMGDLTGIDLKIIIKSLNKARLAGVLVMVMDCVHTPRRIMAMNITLQVESRVIQKVCDTYFAPGAVNVMDGPLANPDALIPGMVQAAAGNLVYRCIRRATALVLSGEVKAMATTSLNREVLHPDGHNCPGHTELLAHLTGSKEYAAVLYTGKLKVIHISTHISLHKFLDILSGERVKTVIHVTNHFLKHVGTERPCIAVAGVDPHVGGHGLFDTEEIGITAPAIGAVQAEDIDVIGLCPSDTMFIQCHGGLFDMVVAMYHGQGHIPLKLFGFYDGVSIIAGLPFVHTSADHGTAFDTVQTGKAKLESMVVSIQLAMQISRE